MRLRTKIILVILLVVSIIFTADKIEDQKQQGFDILNILIDKTEENNQAIEEIYEIILNNSVEFMGANKDNLVDSMQNLTVIAEENAAGTEEA